MSSEGEITNSPLHVSLSRTLRVLSLVSPESCHLVALGALGRSPIGFPVTFILTLPSPPSHVAKSHGYIEKGLQWLHWTHREVQSTGVTQKHRVFYSWL